MESSIEQLEKAYHALQPLVQKHCESSGATHRIEFLSSWIADTLKSYNPQLSNGWMNVSETFSEINGKMQYMFGSLMDDLAAFFHESRKNDDAAIDIVKAINEQSTALLGELNAIAGKIK